MSVQFRANPVAGNRRQVQRAQLGAILLAGLVAALAGGCASLPPSPLAGVHPAEPGSRVASVGYRPTIAPYRRQRPAEPAPWRELNERVAPAPRE